MWVSELISEFLLGEEEKEVERREQRKQKQTKSVAFTDIPLMKRLLA